MEWEGSSLYLWNSLTSWESKGLLGVTSSHLSPLEVHASTQLQADNGVKNKRYICTANLNHSLANNWWKIAYVTDLSTNASWVPELTQDFTGFFGCLSMKCISEQTHQYFLLVSENKLDYKIS